MTRIDEGREGYCETLEIWLQKNNVHNFSRLESNQVLPSLNFLKIYQVPFKVQGYHKCEKVDSGNQIITGDNENRRQKRSS